MVRRRYSRFTAFPMGKGFWTSPSFLWKEVPRRGGGWLPQQDETKSETAHPPVSSSRAQPSIFLAGGKTVHMRKSVIPSPMKYGVYRSSHTLRFTGVQGRFLDFARNDNTGKAILSFSACSRRIFPLSFIPRVPYPPLQDTFPSRERLWVWGSGILVSPPSPWEKDFGLLPPSFGRRCPEGAEVGSRSRMKRKVRQPILPFRHPERSPRSFLQAGKQYI